MRLVLERNSDLKSHQVHGCLEIFEEQDWGWWGSHYTSSHEITPQWTLNWTKAISILLYKYIWTIWIRLKPILFLKRPNGFFCLPCSCFPFLFVFNVQIFHISVLHVTLLKSHAWGGLPLPHMQYLNLHMHDAQRCKELWTKVTHNT